MKELFFHFDFGSPFAYLGAMQVEAVAARHGALVRYRPFLLGALYRAIGTPDVPFFAMSVPKRLHMAADMVRWADHLGVPFRCPSRYPMVTLKPLRMVLALPESERASLVRALFEALWIRDADLADDAVLAEVAGSGGAALVARAREESAKRALFDATAEAVRLGLCGAPSFRVGDDVFWGQDRLDLVEDALRRHPSAA